MKRISEFGKLENPYPYVVCAWCGEMYFNDSHVWEGLHCPCHPQFLLMRFATEEEANTFLCTYPVKKHFQDSIIELNAYGLSPLKTSA